MSLKITRKRLSTSIMTASAIFAFLVQPLVALNIPAAFATGGDALYVSASGDDTRDCKDMVSPCRTLDKAIERSHQANNSDVDTIEVLSDLTVSEQVTVDRGGLTIDGNGHTITGTFDKSDESNDSVISVDSVQNATVIIKDITVDGSSKNVHGIEAFDSDDVQLQNVTVQNNGRSGVNIVSSDVVVDNITTKNNVWHGIDVDLSNGTVSNASAKLTVNGTSTHDGETNDIFVDRPTLDVSVVDTNSQYGSVDFFGAKVYFLRPAAPTDLGFTQSGGHTLSCGAATNGNRKYSTHLHWTIPNGETETYYRVTPTYPSGSHGTPYTWTSGTDVWVGANIGQGYGAAPNDQGVYKYSVQYKNANGIWSYPAECELLYDTTAPHVTYTSPVANSYINTEHDLTVTGTYDDFGGSGVNRIHLYVSKGTLYNSNDHIGYFTATLNTLDETFSRTITASQLASLGLQTGDEFTITAVPFDNVNNGSTTRDNVTVKVDNTAPDAPVINLPLNNQYFNSSPILDRWSAVTDTSGIDHYQIAYSYDNGHSFGSSTCAGDATVPVNSYTLGGFVGCRDVNGTSRNHTPASWEEGGVTIWVRAIDTVGNVGVWSSPVHYYYDHTEPTATDISLNGSSVFGDTTQANCVVPGSFYPVNDTINFAAKFNDISGMKNVKYVIREILSNGCSKQSTLGFGYHGMTGSAGVYSGIFDTMTVHDEGKKYIVHIVGTDLANNQSERNIGIVVDNTAPTVELTAPNDGDIVNHSVNLRGTVVDANPHHYWLQIKKDGSTINIPGVTGTRNESNSFTDKLLTTLTEEGEYEVTLAARDAAGGTSTSGNRSADVVVNFTIDSTAPDVPTATYSERDSGDTVLSGGFTNEENFIMSLNSSSDTTKYFIKYWNTIPGSEYDTNGLAHIWNVDLTGTSHMPSLGTYTDNFTQGEGTHYISFSACDAAGNCSAYSDPFVMTYDKTDPAVTVTPITDLYGFISNVDVHADIDDGVSYKVFVNGTKVTSGSAPFVDYTLPVTTGVYNVYVEATDAAGNTGTSAVSTLTIDNAAPLLTLNGYEGTDTTPTITGTTDGADDVVTVDGANATVSTTANTDGTYDWTYTLPTQSVGEHTVTVVSTDTFGNSTTDTGTVKVTEPQSESSGGSSNVTFTPDGNPTDNSADQGVLGASTDNNADSDTGSSQGVLGTSTQKEDGTFNILGLAWYWWLPILAAIIGFFWWLIAALRRRAQENA